MYKNTC